MAETAGPPASACLPLRGGPEPPQNSHEAVLADEIPELAAQARRKSLNGIIMAHSATQFRRGLSMDAKCITGLTCAGALAVHNLK
jgi:hypothetical protein